MRCGIRLNRIHNQNQNPNTNVNLNPIPNQTECESNQETTCVANYTCRADTNTHTHIERYGAYNEWLCVWNPYNAVNWVLPPLPLLPCFSFHFSDYTLHHAKQQYQQQQEQIDDMFGQFIIMRKSKFENIAGIAGVCQKVLPIFRRCLKNEKGVANWNWVTVFGRGTLHCLHPIAQMSVQSTVIRHHRFAK